MSALTGRPGRPPRQSLAVAGFFRGHPDRYWTIRQVMEQTGAGREATRTAIQAMIAAGQLAVDSSCWPNAYQWFSSERHQHAQEFTAGPDGLLRCAACGAAITDGTMVHGRGCTAIVAAPAGPAPRRGKRPR
jgi:hypothetical protein